MKTHRTKQFSRVNPGTRDRVHGRRRRITAERQAEERVQDMALTRLVCVLENAHAEEVPHLTGRFRAGDGFSRLARLRAAHASYALATMSGLERASDGAFVRTE